MRQNSELTETYKNNFKEFVQLAVKKYNNSKHSEAHF